MINPNKVGLVVGAVIGGWHVIWALLVLLGWAQLLIDFIFWAHMIQPVYIIKAFEFRAALTLLTVTFLIGYAFGFFGAILWNKLHQTHEEIKN